MHDDAYIGRRSENNIKSVVHDDLGWKNRTTRYILPRHWLYAWFSQFHRRGTYSVLSRSHSFVCVHVIMCICFFYLLSLSNDHISGMKTSNNISPHIVIILWPPRKFSDTWPILKFPEFPAWWEAWRSWLAISCNSPWHCRTKCSWWSPVSPLECPHRVDYCLQNNMQH